jgi:hypothetical protein
MIKIKNLRISNLNSTLHSITGFILLFASLFLISIPESQAKENKGFFYKISTDSSTVYLLGSIHFGKAEWYPMSEHIETAFNKSDFLVTEIDIQKIDPMLLINVMTFQDTTTLRWKLKPENYSKVVESFNQMGMTEVITNKMRPWFAAITYQTIKTVYETNLDQQYGVDVYFTEKANQKNLEIKEIETPQSQIELLLEFDNFANEIIETSDIDAENDEMDKLVDAWERGNDTVINNLINQQDKDYPQMADLMEKILGKRNLNMANSIGNYLKEKKTHFIVIGAGHLVGEKSIIQNLKNLKKYKIERL